MNLDNIVGVRVKEEEVRYLGKSHIVVFLLDTGITIGATQSYTFGCSKLVSAVDLMQHMLF